MLPKDRAHDTPDTRKGSEGWDKVANPTQKSICSTEMLKSRPAWIENVNSVAPHSSPPIGPKLAPGQMASGSL